MRFDGLAHDFAQIAHFACSFAVRAQVRQKVGPKASVASMGVDVTLSRITVQICSANLDSNFVNGCFLCFWRVSDDKLVGCSDCYPCQVG